jgi:ribonuclease HI
VDEFSSIFSGDPALAARLLDALERVEKGESFAAAFSSAGVSDADAGRFLAGLKKELAERARSGRKSPPAAKKKRKTPPGTLVAYTDGGSRGNPGPAACAAIIRDGSGDDLLQRTKTLGRATNNVAEYEGAILALELCGELKATRVVLRMDSELIVRQVQGSYKVKHPDLKPFHARLVALARAFVSFQIEHIPRKDNADADKLVNAALDGKADE